MGKVLQPRVCQNLPKGPIQYKSKGTESEKTSEKCVFLITLSKKIVLFPPIWTLFWTLSGWRVMGGDHVPKFLRHFFPEYCVNIYIFGIYKSNLTFILNELIHNLTHKGGWGEGSWRRFLTMSTRKNVFFLLCFPPVIGGAPLLLGTFWI